MGIVVMPDGEDARQLFACCSEVIERISDRVSRNLHSMAGDRAEWRG